jgi:hypothetical protein
MHHDPDSQISSLEKAVKSVRMKILIPKHGTIEQLPKLTSPLHCYRSTDVTEKMGCY